jgi:NAD(P)-dependent dehydrogenase (short-subunit alcohol dehydrogenase family)
VAQGHAVALADRDAQALSHALSRLPAGRATGERLDVTDEAAMRRWIASLPPLAGCIASAGISADTPALETDLSTFRLVLEVNLIGSYLLAREAGRRMAGAGGGAIVLIASVSGLLGPERRVAYGASKAGCINMAQSMAIDLAPHGIRVNAICPGPVETPMVTALHDAQTRAAWLARIPLRRYAEPRDIAEAALFLLDPARSGSITGHALAVDGGYAGAGLMPGASPPHA